MDVSSLKKFSTVQKKAKDDHFEIFATNYPDRRELNLVGSDTLSGKFSANKLSGEQYYSADKIFGIKSKFRQFGPPTFFYENQYGK